MDSNLLNLLRVYRRAPAPLLTLTSPSFSPVLDPCCSFADPHCLLLPPFLHCHPSSPAPYLLPPPSSGASSFLPCAPARLASTSPLPPRSIRLLIRCQFAINIQAPWLTKSSPSPGWRAVKTRATSCSSLLEEPQEQLLLFGTPLDAVRDTVHRSDYQAIGEGYDRFGSLARAPRPVQLLKYATRTVWFKNVNTGYPVDRR